MIQIENLVKRYGDLVALDHLNLNVEEGEIFGLLGPNGSGKTTAINCMLALLKFDKGSIRIFGEEMAPDNYRVKGQIGVVMQDVAVFDELNVYENIVLPVELDGDTVDQKFLDEIVHLLGLEDKLKNMPNNLSGGQQQRVAIARALITKPAIVLADEPTGNLDSKTSTEVLGLIKRTSADFRQTVVMITHNNDIARLADRIVRIEDGKIVE